MEYSVVIVAAGSGSRMGLGYNKMLFQLKNGRTILEETVLKFYDDKRCKQVIVVASDYDLETFQTLFKDKNIEFTKGGKTRQDSVYQGLKKVRQNYVFIHDGARPWISKDCINRIVKVLETKEACLLMMPVKDTIKVVEDGKVINTPKRSTLYLAQTPQAFVTKKIIKAYDRAYEKGIQATDDAQIMELCGDCEVYMVEGSYENMKVTTKEDIEGK